MSSIYDLDDFKIQDLVDEIFDDQPANLIDFKRHLQADKALNKIPYFNLNGRPSYAEYYYNDVLYAKRLFEFIVDPSTDLIQQRIEKLIYIKRDDSEGPEIVIKNKTYDLQVEGDRKAVKKERNDARSSIIDDIEMVIAGVLEVALSINLDDTIVLIEPFWGEYSNDIYKFINLGSETFKDALAAIDLNTTSYTWLSIPVDQQGTTVRDYMVSRLTY